MDICGQVIQVRIERRSLIVVVHFAIGELRMTDGEVKNAGVAAALGCGWRWQIARSFRAHLNVHDRMIDKKFT